MLKYRDTSPYGSFVAWGISFEYEYNKDKKTLDITDSRRATPLLSFDYCNHLNQLPLNFIGSIEKITQIQALIGSNSESIDLSDIYTGLQLVSLLESAIKLSSYSWDLRRERFEEFDEKFSSEYNVKSTSLKKYAPTITVPGFYSGEIKTRSNNAVSSSSAKLYKTIAKLSDMTMSDLATREYAENSPGSAHNMLTVASNLSIISKSLNDSYVPRNHLTMKQQTLINMKNKFSSNFYSKTGV